MNITPGADKHFPVPDFPEFLGRIQMRKWK
jgi:hypothetical protein